MKFDIEKIIEIKNEIDLKKFNCNKPIFYNNYLFHYLIMLNKLDILKLNKHPIHNFNEENLDGFMVAAKYSNYNILEYLLQEYPEYSQNHNSEGLNFINYIDTPSIVISMMKKFVNINWAYLLKFKNEENIEYYKYLLSELNKEDLIWFLKKYNVFSSYYSIYSIIINENIKNNDKINILNNFSDTQINEKNYENIGIIVDLINLENILFIEYFLNRNIDVEYIFNQTTFFITPFYYLLLNIFNNMNDNLINILDLISKKIKLDYNFVNNNGSNYIHLVLKSCININIEINPILKKIINKILTESPDESWNVIDLNKKSPVYYLLKYPVKKYIHYIKDRTLNIDDHILNSATKEWYDELIKIKKLKVVDDIKLDVKKFQHHTKFTATMLDIIIYFIYLSKKYKNLYIPKIHNNIFREDFSWIINYSTGYIDIHPNLNAKINTIRREGQYDYALVFLALNLPNDLKHANILLYDFKNLTIEHFEPFGGDDIESELHTILDEELTWNTGLKYLKPVDFLPKPGYQLLSNENNTYNLKVGDFGGFCLGWCIWYVEHRLNNTNIDVITLNKKTLEKLLKLDYSLTEFIRNYSNKLFNEKYNIIKNICSDNVCIRKQNISNIYLSKEETIKIFNYANEFFGIEEKN